MQANTSHWVKLYRETVYFKPHQPSTTPYCKFEQGLPNTAKMCFHINKFLLYIHNSFMGFMNPIFST